MSIEIEDKPRSINDINLVEGMFLNSMICLIQQQSAKTSWIQNGRLPERMTWSVMKIGPTHVRNLAMMMSLMEQDTKQNLVFSSDTKPGTPVKQSELYVSESTWSYAETLGTVSGRLFDGIPFLDKDRCTFQDWLLIDSILESPVSTLQSNSLIPELTQSIADCYR